MVVLTPALPPPPPPGEKHASSKLLAPSKSSEKMYKIDDHVTTVVAGLTADANILIEQARVTAQRYIYTYQEPMPVRPCTDCHSGLTYH